MSHATISLQFRAENVRLEEGRDTGSYSRGSSSRLDIH